MTNRLRCTGVCPGVWITWIPPQIANSSPSWRVRSTLPEGSVENVRSKLLALRFGQRVHHLDQALATHLNQRLLALDVGFVIFVSQDLDLAPANAGDFRQASYMVDILVSQDDTMNALEIHTDVFDLLPSGTQLSSSSTID